MLKYLGVIAALLSAQVMASNSAFTNGPVFKDYGQNIVVKGGLVNPEQQKFKVVFDIADAAKIGEVNRQFNTVARFINMHVRAGVAKENIEVAMVVHGKAGFDLLQNKIFKQKFGGANSNEQLIKLLLQEKVEIYLCGQSASALGIENKQLIDGVTLSLSAMTANALLQQRGFTLNPF